MPSTHVIVLQHSGAFIRRLRRYWESPYGAVGGSGWVSDDEYRTRVVKVKSSMIPVTRGVGRIFWIKLAFFALKTTYIHIKLDCCCSAASGHS